MTQSEKMKSKKGRPPCSLQRSVPDNLLAAVEKRLQDKSHTELTVREIALAAGVSEAMIGYYFQSKDGLLIVLIDQLLREIHQTLDELLQNIAVISGNPTQELVTRLVNVYYRRPAIAKVVLTELSCEKSAIKQAYFARGNSRLGLAKTAVKIRAILSALVERGVYDKSLNLRLASFTIFSLVVAPLAASPSNLGIPIEELQHREWINYFTRLLDHHFRSPNADVDLELPSLS